MLHFEIRVDDLDAAVAHAVAAGATLAAPQPEGRGRTCASCSTPPAIPSACIWAEALSGRHGG